MRRKFFLVLSIMFFGLGVLFEFSGISNIPSEINISYKDRVELKCKLPIELSLPTTDVLSVEQSENNYEIVADEYGETTVNVSLLGIPVKSVNVNVYQPKDVVPGGQSMGVALYTKGALVVGMGDIEDELGKVSNPAKEAGLKSGDIIERVDGILINDAEHVENIINEIDSSNQTKLDIKRNDEKMTISITPVKDVSDGKYRLGIWVRDSMAGVGTLSFYDPVSMKYASLGHAIYDSDTKTLLNVKSGKVVETEIYSVEQGQKGNPGQLKGSYDADKEKLGNITKNNDFGLYGTFFRVPNNDFTQKTMKTALVEEVKTGKATILCTVDDTGVKEYDIEIEKTAKQSYPGIKSMVIRITDKELLNKTGGIVQGMSGSPILQNGKIVGAVTHVLVNDPTRGYGLYAQWMVEEMK